MSERRNNPKIDPRSPVQPGGSPAPYFVAAFAAAVLVWTAQQYWGSDGTPETGHVIRSNEGIEPQAAQPSRGDVRTVFSADDYPAQAAANGEQGTVQAQLTVDESGRVSRCAIVRSSGHSSLDSATCDILQRRAHFTPARDADGNAIESTVVTPPIRWQLEG